MNFSNLIFNVEIILKVFDQHWGIFVFKGYLAHVMYSIKDFLSWCQLDDQTFSIIFCIKKSFFPWLMTHFIMSFCCFAFIDWSWLVFYLDFMYMKHVCIISLCSLSRHCYVLKSDVQLFPSLVQINVCLQKMIKWSVFQFGIIDLLMYIHWTRPWNVKLTQQMAYVILGEVTTSWVIQPLQHWCKVGCDFLL